MRVAFNAKGQNSFLNVQRTNQGIAKKQGTTALLQTNRHNDTVMISAQGKANSQLESLAEQKVRISEHSKAHELGNISMATENQALPTATTKKEITLTQMERRTDEEVLRKDPYTIIVHSDGTVIDKRGDESRAGGYTYFDLVKAAMGGDMLNICRPGSNFQEASRLVSRIYDPPHDSSYKDSTGKEILLKNGKPIARLNLTQKQYQSKLQNEVKTMLDYLKDNKSQFANLYQLHFGA